MTPPVHVGVSLETHDLPGNPDDQISTDRWDASDPRSEISWIVHVGVSLETHDLPGNPDDQISTDRWDASEARAPSRPTG
jgi:hypothetical protein